MLNPESIRSDFPIFEQRIHKYPLIYFDNAASTQKPYQVIQAMSDFYLHEYASVHRGIYPLAEQATKRYEDARVRIAHFIAADPQECIFTSGTTHGINLIAHAWGKTHIHEGDEIVLTEREHHSLLLPLQQLAFERKARLKFIPVTSSGLLDMRAVSSLITSRTKLVAVSTVSNVTGESIDLAVIVQSAKKVGARILVDAAQSIAHEKTDVKKWDVDFLVFSAHKILGPTGIGCLYIKKEVQDEVPPFHFGGAMVYHAEYAHAQWRKGPHKFEAGTPAIAQAIGFAAALEYIENKIDFEQLQQLESSLCARLIAGLVNIPSITILGDSEQLAKNGHLVSFAIAGIHAHDAAAYLANHGICVRAGNLCAQPFTQKLGIESALRISFYAYNTSAEVDFTLQCIQGLIKQWRG